MEFLALIAVAIIAAIAVQAHFINQQARKRMTASERKLDDEATDHDMRQW